MQVPWSGNGMNVRVTHADTRDVNLTQLLWCANNKKFSFVIQFKIVIQHRQTNIQYAIFMLFMAKNGSDLRLELNEM